MRLQTLCFALALLVAVGAASGTRAVDSDYLIPDLESVRAKIKAKDFKAALEELRLMTANFDNADVYNLLGFSLRKTGQYPQAYVYYRKALDLDPGHKGALEYLGELYVETGQIDKARRARRAVAEALSERLRGARGLASGDRRRGEEIAACRLIERHAGTAVDFSRSMLGRSPRALSVIGGRGSRVLPGSITNV